MGIRRRPLRVSAAVASLALLVPAATTFLAGEAMGQPLSDSSRRQLLDAAARLGEVPVIVTLRLPAPAADDPAAIAPVRDRLLADLGVAADAAGELAGPGIGNVKVFETQPMIAMTVTAAALARLAVEPLVARIEPDTPVPPTAPPGGPRR